MSTINANIEGVLTFNSTRTYTLAILNSLNGVKHWVKNTDGTYNEKDIPIKFGNYEKSIELADISKDLVENGNFNFIPRMVLAFVGMRKESGRTTNKHNKISKRVIDQDGEVQLNFGYNSVAYDFDYQLVLQARGLNEAFQIVEQILPMFRPTYPVSIREFPLFEEMTETVLTISDPAFEILDEFGADDVNIVNVSFDLSIRGNLYMPLQLAGPIRTIRMMTYLWDTYDIEESQLASHFEFDVCDTDGKIYNTDIHRAYAPAKIKYKKPVDAVEDSVCTPDELSIINTSIFDDIITEDGEPIISEEVR